jgi:glycosyltransferase involved in cell wall biosynthesis
VSVIVPSRNGVGLPRLIERLAAQTLGRERFEVMVADDGSSDGSTDLLPVDGRWLQLTRGIRHNSYAARNRAARLARGQVLAFTDADCLPRPDWLVNGLHALGSADLVAGQIEFLLPARPTVWTVIDSMLFDQRRFVAMGKAATANLFVARALFQQHGGFDETLPSGGDWEFVERAVGAGARLAFAPDVVVQHPTRDTAADFLVRRWRIERAFARRAVRQGRSLITLDVGREAVVPRRFGFAVGFDRQRIADVGLSPDLRTQLLTAPARYAIVPLIDVLAQVGGWLRARGPGAGSPPRCARRARAQARRRAP